MLVLFACLLQTCFKLHNDVLPHQSIEWSYDEIQAKRKLHCSTGGMCASIVCVFTDMLL